MVLRSIERSFPMQPLLCTGNKSIQNIGVNRTVTATLPGPKSDTAPTLTSTHQGTGQRYHQRRNFSQRKRSHQKTANADQEHPHTPSINSDTEAQQRVRKDEQRVREDKQRLINKTPIRTVTRITTAEPIMKSRNPTAKRALKICQDCIDK